ncbi:MAG: hypothetical protein Q8P95_03875 [bacterium]|nr:hypothetical protein [bacterium]
MSKTCRTCQTVFEVTESDLAFLKKVSPIIAGKRYDIPTPTLCPECRLQRRMAWRNDRNLYSRTCDFSGEKIISMFRPDPKVKVYKSDIWWGDGYDARTFGRDYDFSRSFFEQLNELIQTVPWPSLAAPDCENSPYVNYAYKNQNCHLCFAGNFLQDSYYCYNGENSRDCCDCLFINDCENCYELVHCENCYNTKFAVNSKNCSESWFLQDCRSLKNCLLCFNLEHQEYHILNQPYSKEEYQRKLKEYRLDTHQGLERAKKIFLDQRQTHERRPDQNFMTEDCSGEYLNQSKNCQQCYILQKQGEDCKYAFNGFPRIKDAMDIFFCGEDAELIYESVATGGTGQRLLFNNGVVLGVENVLYSIWAVGCKDCFGCVNLRKGQYCILNKQYSKTEYEKLVPKIIEHMKNSSASAEWGEFPDAKYSPFGYNETSAQENFPLEKEQAQKQGFNWSDYQSPLPKVEKTLPASRLPEAVKDIPDDVLNWAILCEETQRPYKIVAQELRFYRKHQLPLPRRHPDVRHNERLKLRNPRTKWK